MCICDGLLIFDTFYLFIVTFYDVVGVGIGIIVVVEPVSIVYLFYSIYLGWNEMIRVHRSVETTCVPGGYHEM